MAKEVESMNKISLPDGTTSSSRAGKALTASAAPLIIDLTNYREGGRKLVVTRASDTCRKLGIKID